jgi:hypothetical protein
MEWNQSDVLALAMEKCAICDGLGMKTCASGETAVCNCVQRKIFKICYDRFKVAMLRKEAISRPNQERSSSADGKFTWGRKEEEYIADFLLVAKRTLDDSDYLVFKYHFLLGADWKLCCRKLKVEKGRYFHSLYRLMSKLGRTFAELQPYPLYPLNDYFHGERRGSVAIMPRRNDNSLSGKVPLREAA